MIRASVLMNNARGKVPAMAKQLAETARGETEQIGAGCKPGVHGLDRGIQTGTPSQRPVPSSGLSCS